MEEMVMGIEDRFKVLKIVARNVIAMGMAGTGCTMIYNGNNPPGEFWGALGMVLAFYFKSEDG
jgi:hypothetical protein